MPATNSSFAAGRTKLVSLNVKNLQTALNARTSDVCDLARLVNVHGLEIFLRLTGLQPFSGSGVYKVYNPTRPAALQHVGSFVLCLMNAASSGETFPAG